MIVLLLFFCSGATALVYEVIWSKYLSLLFGSTIQAQTVVLAVFMGGLALGNKLFGNRADVARRPLVVYGLVEIAIGLYAFCFSSIYTLAERGFAGVGAGLVEHPGWLLLVKGILSIALLLGPTILMGGTLPMLAAWLQQNTSDAGRRSARFYSTNSLGAVCGSGLAGFVLVQWLGLRSTLAVTAAINVVIGLIAVAIGRRPSVLPAAEPKPTDLASAASEPAVTPPQVFAWGCVLVALTGAVSMGLEVLASRCLSLILGASLQVFGLVLMAFILGIALGSAVIASPRQKHWRKELTTIALLLAAALVIGALVFNIENLALLYSYGQRGLTRTPTGYVFHQIMASVFSICVLGLPAAALGSVLPLWIRAAEASHQLGDRVGRLLTWNTLGAVVGVLVTGFVLMPTIGLRAAFTTLALVLAVAALVMALITRRRIAAVAAAVVSALVILVSVSGGEGWRFVLSSGVFRLPNDVYTPQYIRARREAVKLLFYEDAADATVSVESEPRGGYHNLSLRINGKPDASAPGDMSTQILLGQLPMMMKPDSKEVFVLGMGSGISAGTTLGYPIDHVTVADNCEPVLRAVALFNEWNHGVLTNSRTRLYREDARTVLKLNPQKYDVIISEPSNPWMIGIGSVFSREFYEIAASRLKPGGIMSQWFHTYEVDDEVLGLVLRTFAAVFPAMEIWDVAEGDVVLLGSDRPWKSDVDAIRRAFERELPRRDLGLIGLRSPAAVLARQLASQRTAFALPGPGRIQSDSHPILEYVAPRTFYIYLGRGAQRFQNFDERTVQMDLAPPGKNKALAGLDGAALGAIFGGVSPSVNHALQAYLRAVFGGAADAQSYALLAMPCVFRGTNESVLFMPDVARTNAIANQLFNAEATLKTNPSNRAQAVEIIQRTLDAAQSYMPERDGWSAAYYADLAVKASLRLGETARAKAILLRGLQMEPASEALQYLARILVREGVVKPEEVASVARK